MDIRTKSAEELARLSRDTQVAMCHMADKHSENYKRFQRMESRIKSEYRRRRQEATNA